MATRFRKISISTKTVTGNDVITISFHKDYLFGYYKFSFRDMLAFACPRMLVLDGKTVFGASAVGKYMGGNEVKQAERRRKGPHQR